MHYGRGGHDGYGPSRGGHRDSIENPPFYTRQTRGRGGFDGSSGGRGGFDGPSGSRGGFDGSSGGRGGYDG